MMATIALYRYVCTLLKEDSPIYWKPEPNICSDMLLR
ncbi:hypothetical protein SAMN05428949_4135 [Chitinophaga sp. YR627]|nr:hypothetical protein SAMN05428949_4135 [Chitinophaga sp. YR627]